MCSNKELVVPASRAQIKTGRRGAPQAFARKLYEILEVESPDYISWNDAGTAFFIVNLETFTELILMKYFRHQKFPSFQRQLNLYGFRKVTRGPDTGAYSHKYFVRDRPDLLDFVRRSQVTSNSHKNSTQDRNVPADVTPVKRDPYDCTFPNSSLMYPSNLLSIPFSSLFDSKASLADLTLNLDVLKRFNDNPNPTKMEFIDEKPEKLSPRKSHWCMTEGCNRLPLFGYHGQRALLCNEHRKEGMVNIYEFLGPPSLASEPIKLPFADNQSSMLVQNCRHPGCNENALVHAEYCTQHRLDILLQAATSI
mmetsp:Transcript_15085/g.19780  ORF Transcript_15085/g.19780 Transcript_15085/m.19780 type:complete len:309 (+) Transcript_15085:130-1056(+)